MRSAVRLPKQIDPCPIVESVAEIRFETSLPDDAVFGVVYNAVKERYPSVEKLPILQIPEAIRSGNPDLVILPQYRLRGERFMIQVGPRSISSAVTGPYPGWHDWRTEINYAFDKIQRIDVIHAVTRFGLRYIDVFDGDVFPKLVLKLGVDQENVTSPNMGLRVVFDRGRFNCLLQINNDSVFGVEGTPASRRSVLDVDTYLVGGEGEFFTQAEMFLEEAHATQKELFFGLLSPQFLASLNPTY